MPADGSPIRVGRSLDGDLILRDAGFESASLVCEAGQWRLAIGDEPAVALRMGEAARLGPLLIQVADAHSPWPDLKALTVAFEQPDSTDVLEEARDSSTSTAAGHPASQVVDGADGPGEPVASDETSPSPPNGSDSQRSGIGWLPWALTAGLMLGFLGLGWTLLMPADSEGSRPLSTGAVSQPNESISPAEIEAMVQAIARAGYAQRVRVLSTTDGRALLAGVLDSDEDQEAVLRAASGVSRKLRLSLLSTAEFTAKVRELREQVPGELEIRPSRDGKVILTGLSDEPALIDDAISWIRKALPEAAGIEVEALSRAEAVARFARTVRESRIGDIDIRWDGQRLVARGELLASRLARWERLWLSFSARYGERLKASVELSVVPDPPSLVAKPDVPMPEPEQTTTTIVMTVEPPAKALPRIVLPPIASVISGPRGHVMLRDGSLIFTVGVVNGFRLIAIEDTVLVFEDARGHEFRVSR
ncbi:MAG: hypothetical protein RI906_2767 [Pseudomonadota bacterium]